MIQVIQQGGQPAEASQVGQNFSCVTPPEPDHETCGLESGSKWSEAPSIPENAIRSKHGHFGGNDSPWSEEEIALYVKQYGEPPFGTRTEPSMPLGEYMATHGGNDTVH